MIFLLFIAGVVLVGLSGRLVAQALILPRLRLKQHLLAIQEYGFEPVSQAAAAPEQGKLKDRIDRLAQRAGRFVLNHLSVLSPLPRGDLTAAGFYDISQEAVHGYRAIGALVLPGLITLYLLGTKTAFGLLPLLTVIVGAMAGWQLPAVLIKRRGAARLDEMDRQLPDLIDLLIATVEAGMGLAGSLGLVATRFKGALGEELRMAVQQQALGISTEEALADMAERCDTASMRAFVRTTTRGESLGVSIGPILRELAIDMRRRRRQTAREKMQKAPVKLIFPLMFLILPALMVVILYPAVYNVLQNGSMF